MMKYLKQVNDSTIDQRDLFYVAMMLTNDVWMLSGFLCYGLELCSQGQNTALV